jgi:protein-L-isoaspartate(D-aspartate) O-methyltransferase
MIILYIFMMMLILSCAGKSESNKSDEDYAFLRLKMVETQIERRNIKDKAVLEAMRQVPRHLFVPKEYRSEAYTDGPLPIGHGQTISQPYIVAIMTELLQIDSTSKVLEIGTGSGYQAAVLAEIADSVFSIEIIPALAYRADSLLDSLGYANAEVRAGDGYLGWPEEAPFDAIIVTAAAPKIPQPLIDQLAVNGRMVIPVGEFSQDLMLLTKTEKGVLQRSVIPVRFVPMTGEIQKK